MTSFKTLLAVALIGTTSAITMAQTIPEPAGMSASLSVPGKKTMADVIQVSAEVKAIDVETRRATLVGPKGREFNLTVGPDVQNLESVAVGDMVTVEYARSLTLELHKNGQAAVGRIETVAEGRAPIDEEDGGVRVIDRMVNGVANVVAVDPETMQVSLEGAENSMVVHVADPEQFKLIEVGDQIEATFLEGAALSLTKKASAE